MARRIFLDHPYEGDSEPGLRGQLTSAPHLPADIWRLHISMGRRTGKRLREGGAISGNSLLGTGFLPWNPEKLAGRRADAGSERSKKRRAPALHLSAVHTSRASDLRIGSIAAEGSRSEERRVGKECRARWALRH